MIINLPPGRELDAIIAEKVMGWKSFRTGNHPDNFYTEWFDEQGKTGFLKNYSTDIRAAWEVVEKLEELGFLVGVDEGISGKEILSACMVFLPRGIHWISVGEAIVGAAPHAICLAALKAVEKNS